MIRRLPFLILAILGAAVPLSVAHAQPSAAEWASIRGADVALVPPGWSTPEPVAGASSPGYEDGASVSPDGRTVFFVARDIDPWSGRITGPNRDPDRSCVDYGIVPSSCGTGGRADLFQVRDGVVTPHPLTLNRPLGGFHMIDSDSAVFMRGFETSTEDIGIAQQSAGGEWSEAQELPGVSSGGTDRDPWADAAELRVLFSSRRSGGAGKDDIYESRRASTSAPWSTPRPLPAPINGPDEDMQPFMRGDWLYFMSDRNGGPARIYRARELGDGSWGTPEIVVESRYGVGEPTLSADGNTMVFVQLFMQGEHQNFEVMVSRRLQAPPAAPSLLP